MRHADELLHSGLASATCCANLCGEGGPERGQGVCSVMSGEDLGWVGPVPLELQAPAWLYSQGSCMARWFLGAITLVHARAVLRGDALLPCSAGEDTQPRRWWQDGGACPERVPSGALDS